MTAPHPVLCLQAKAHAEYAERVAAHNVRRAERLAEWEANVAALKVEYEAKMQAFRYAARIGVLASLCMPAARMQLLQHLGVHAAASVAAVDRRADRSYHMHLSYPQIHNHHHETYM